MKELYDVCIKLFKELMLKHESAMMICQSIGYNGFKRWHRRRAKKFFCWAIGLENELFDNYRKTPTLAIMPSTYSAESLKEHLAAWDACLEHGITALIDISKQFIDRTGLPNCHVKCAIKCLAKDREKTRRWYARFTDSNWSAHDTHIVDDMLHAKEKRKEGGDHAGKTHNPY